MGLAHSPRIITDGLVSVSDSRNPSSYSGETFFNRLTSNAIGNPSWANNATELTCILDISIYGYDTSYAYHPVSKWNTGTTTASFVLYHFQNYQGTSLTSANRIGWYANGGGSWQGISGQTVLSIGNSYFVVLQYNSSNGGQLWVNDSKIGGRSGSGVLGSGTSSVNIDGGVSGRSGIHKVNSVYFYDRELSDTEIQQNFIAFRGRFGI